MIGLGERTKGRKGKNAKRAKMQILRDNSPWLSSVNTKIFSSRDRGYFSCEAFKDNQ